MEEKARLSREQEMQQHYKSQGALQLEPSVVSSGASAVTKSSAAVTKSSVRDLSSSLLNSAVHVPSAPVGGGSSVLPSAVSSVSTVCWASTHSAGMTSQSWSGWPQPTKSSVPARTVDMSALDDIMPLSGKTRPTLNSMVQQSPASGPNPFGTAQSIMAPAHGPAAAGFGPSSVMMPGLSSQMGPPASFGGVRPMAPGNSSTMGNIPVFIAQQPAVPQGTHQHLSTTSTTTSLSNKDIADLLG